MTKISFEPKGFSCLFSQCGPMSEELFSLSHNIDSKVDEDMDLAEAIIRS